MPKMEVMQKLQQIGSLLNEIMMYMGEENKRNNYEEERMADENNLKEGLMRAMGEERK